jgi:PAS domain S-box-containing protein
MDNENKLSDKHIQDKLSINNSLFFKTLLEYSQMAAIFVMDEKGIILRTNPGVLHNFGYSEKDVVGKNFSLLFTKEDTSASNPQKELKAALETGSGIDNNYVVHKNNRRLWCTGESILTKTEEGKKFIVKIVFNIDEQKRLENALSHRNKDLSTFIYATSHDLKSPINNIEGLINDLAGNPDVEKFYGMEIGLIRDSIRKFKDLLNDLTEIGKQQEDAISEIVFKQILEEVTFNLRDAIKSSKAVISSDFSNAPLIRFSKMNLRSIFHNLLSNAIKYHSPGVKPEINFSTELCDSDLILLKVSDNGIGIKEDDKSKVFSIYSRLNKDIEGTGVGMAIVSRIVENNGGKIEIESAEGKGSTFLIYLKDQAVSQ